MRVEVESRFAGGHAGGGRLASAMCPGGAAGGGAGAVYGCNIRASGVGEVSMPGGGGCMPTQVVPSGKRYSRIRGGTITTPCRFGFGGGPGGSGNGPVGLQLLGVQPSSTPSCRRNGGVTCRACGGAAGGPLKGGTASGTTGSTA